MNAEGGILLRRTSSLWTRDGSETNSDTPVDAPDLLRASPSTSIEPA